MKKTKIVKSITVTQGVSTPEIETVEGYFFTSQELEDKLRKAFRKGGEYRYHVITNIEHPGHEFPEVNEDEYIDSLNL